jgi:hypothetical protein
MPDANLTCFTILQSCYHCVAASWSVVTLADPSRYMATESGLNSKRLPIFEAFSFPLLAALCTVRADTWRRQATSSTVNHLVLLFDCDILIIRYTQLP